MHFILNVCFPACLFRCSLWYFVPLSPISCPFVPISRLNLTFLLGFQCLFKISMYNVMYFHAWVWVGYIFTSRLAADSGVPPPQKKKLRNESATKILLHKIVNFVTHQAIIYELICYRMTFARKYISRQFFCFVLCFIEEW